ncbi:MAG: SAV_6107 family HEPN domain-containing protein [Actinomycetota bacterium]|nr:SAV_6107 family HEPN domain-containing protein [Actinomycetota bacterium]
MTALMNTARPIALPPATYELIAASRRSLTEAMVAGCATDRYAAAHLAALRAAAAVLAARGRRRARSRVRSVWLVLPEVAVELTEWAGFFAAGARKRALAEAGVPCVTAREADDLVREAESFVERVVTCLGVSHQPTLPTGFRSAPVGAVSTAD